jgi:hypothetical protein
MWAAERLPWEPLPYNATAINNIAAPAILYWAAGYFGVNLADAEFMVS